MTILPVFIGFDERQPIAVQVLIHSIYRRASRPVACIPLLIEQMPIKRQGLTQFTFSRYCVPFLCEYEGVSVFLDADMLMLGDIHELVSLRDPKAAVSVVKNKMRFEWPSMMVFNNDLCKKLTPSFIEVESPQSLSWSEKIGELPPEWNHCVGYDSPRDNAKIAHFTQGIPCFKEVAGCEYSQQWIEEHKACNSTVSWTEIMGRSVHAKPVMERLAAA